MSWHPDQDPFKYVARLWPNDMVYGKQQEIIESVWDNDETFVPAGNMLGKDWIAGRIAVLFFMLHHPVRIVTTSVADQHLVVLWGEINRAIQTSEIPLLRQRAGAFGKQQQGGNGPLVVNHREIRKVVDGVQCPVSYVLGMVAEDAEKFAGHHAPSTLIIGDECSGLWDEYRNKAMAWAGGGGELLPNGCRTRKRMLWIGNCYPSSGFWRQGIEAGDLLAKE